MTERDFVFAASMDLRWFPPKDAQRMLTAAARAGLLTSESGHLRPTFDVNALDIPVDFVPTTAVLELPEAAEDLFTTILARIVEDTGLETKAVVAEVNRVQARMGIDLEAAALLVGRAHGAAIEGFIDPVAARNRNRSPLSPRG